jgi:hypothetical protein
LNYYYIYNLKEKTYEFYFELLSLNYKGVDTKVKIDVDVRKSSTKRLEHFKKIEEIDKKEVYTESNMLQKVLQNIAGVDNCEDECLTESESENEEENENKKKN